MGLVVSLDRSPDCSQLTRLLQTYALSLLRRVFTVCLSCQWAPFIGKRVSASSAVPRLHQEGRPSAAQRCNDDVLDEIFAELECSALASAALVCRGWLFPARVRLYRDLFLNNYGAPHSDKLADILPNQPLLRSLIRRPVLRYCRFGRPCTTLFDWMALLPEHSFQSVTIRDIDSTKKMPFPTLATLLDFPAVRTSPRLIVHCRTFITSERLDKVLGMPCLESLSFMISDRVATRLKEITVFPRNLKRLSIRADAFSPHLAQLLRRLPSPLERFDLQCEELKEFEMVFLCYALQQHSSTLRHLVLLGMHFSSVPAYLDGSIEPFSHLETLLLPFGLYSPDLFAHLPPTISSLSLCTPWGPESLEIGEIDELASALQQECSRLPLLKSMTMVRCQADPLEDGPLVQVCSAHGITLREIDISNIDIMGDEFIRSASITC